jgi:hypothetical protein
MNLDTEPSAHRFPALHDTGVRILLGVFTGAALLACAYMLEPLVTFRPVEAVVVGAGGVGHVELRGRRSTSYDAYQSDIFYRYEVAGVPYMGRQYRRADLEGSALIARLRSESFSGGVHVHAWYNPLHPDEAVLNRAPSVNVMIWTIVIAGLPWFAALILQPSPASGRRDSAPTE